MLLTTFHESELINDLNEQRLIVARDVKAARLLDFFEQSEQGLNGLKDLTSNRLHDVVTATLASEQHFNRLSVNFRF